jgi:hypothetical protein
MHAINANVASILILILLLLLIFFLILLFILILLFLIPLRRLSIRDVSVGSALADAYRGSRGRSGLRHRSPKKRVRQGGPYEGS